MFIVPLTQIQPITPIEGAKTESVSGDGSQGVKSFADTLKNAVQGVRDLESESLQGAYDLATGKTDDLESVMLQSAKASTAIELTVQLTTRAVNAYKDIMAMQI